MDRKRRAIALVAAGCLFLQAALAPRAARAEVVQSKYGPVIYTWSDAVKHVDVLRGLIYPQKTVKKDGGIWVVKDTLAWAADDLAEDYAPDIADRMEQPLAVLSRRGIPPEAYSGLKVFVMPAYSIEILGVGFAGCYTPGSHIYLAGLRLDSTRVFLHELGHHVAAKYLSVPLDDWSMANGVGRSYLLLKGIDPNQVKLRKEDQLNLPWKQQIVEIWANDFASWAYRAYLQSDGRPGAAVPLEDRISSWFDRFA